MSKLFKRGLVVGKFAPLHRGHEVVIERAVNECEEVVLLSYSKPEFPGCDPARRERWLANLFPNTRRLVITDESLTHYAHLSGAPREVPHNKADDLTHRRFCGFVCQHILGFTVDAVFTSEDYGDGFAAELTRYFREHDVTARVVQHVLVDKGRVAAPISGTQLRQDVHAHRHWLSPIVYASFIQRVCLLGGESTGKSTLAERLAREFSTMHVPEYGRELWEARSGELAFDDLRHIAEVQVRREDEALLRARRYVFCDTSPLTTLFYSRHLFGKADAVLEHLAGRAYDFTFLCAPDFPFVQDGTRQPESFRMLQHEWYLRELSERRIPSQTITGGIEARLQQVREIINAVR
jgi:HTH-type transcriptional regulator, transcriptional repressor of NAD biosynthesis genes